MKLCRAILPPVLLLIMGWSVSSAGAQAMEDAKVQARLVADTVEVGPGSTLRLGVLFEIEDGWHIYWRNPGEAGLATAVDFEFPDGVVAGPLQWPLPIAFTQSEGIPGFGYEGSVLLASEVTVPENFDRSRPTQIRAEVSWLACKDVCVLGSAELEGSLAQLSADPAFREWDRRLPMPLEGNDPPFSLSSTGGVAEGTVTHWLRWHQSPQLVEWFPNPSAALEVGELRVKTRGGLTRIDAAVRARKGVSGSISELPCVVVVTDGEGDRRGWELTVNLKKQGS